MIDLHVHSTFSDGSLTPEELVEQAIKEGVAALALTDHDSIGGLERFEDAGKAKGLKTVPGIEISVDHKGGAMHVLGYFLDIKNHMLVQRLETIRNGRISRNQDIIRKLNALGIDIEMEDVQKFAGEDLAGRLHFAQALLAKRVVKSKNEAFDRFLGSGKPAYSDRVRFSKEDALKMIVEGGGVPVLAHPVTLKLKAKDMDALIREMTDCGMKGIEAYYTEHSTEKVREYVGYAKRYGLVATGGSDFHGVAMPDIRIGRGFGSLNVPDSVLDELEAAR